MEEELFALLDDGLSFPVAWGRLPQGTGAQRARITRTSAVRQRLLEGPGLTQGRVQVDCFGNQAEDAIAASRAVRGLLEHHRGTRILGVFLDAIRDFDEDDAGILHRVSLTFSITYNET